jgi:hypothetical protein
VVAAQRQRCDGESGGDSCGGSGGSSSMGRGSGSGNGGGGGSSRSGMVVGQIQQSTDRN